MSIINLSKQIVIQYVVMSFVQYTDKQLVQCMLSTLAMFLTFYKVAPLYLVVVLVVQEVVLFLTVELVTIHIMIFPLLNYFHHVLNNVL